MDSGMDARLQEERLQHARNGDVARLEAEVAAYRAALESSLDPIVVIDDMGVVRFASDSVETVFGWPPAELVGRNVKVLMPEPHRARHDEYLSEWRRTGVTHILGRTREFEVVRRDGTRLRADLSVSKATLPDGSVILTGNFRDVTERRRAEERLRESERRFHAIFDQAYQYLGLLAPDGTLLEANQTALQAGRQSLAEVVGKPFWQTHWWSLSAETQRRVREAVERAARGEFVRFEVQIASRHGEPEDIDFSLKPVHDEDGRVVLLIPEGRNISELKRAQRAETSMLRALAEVGESAAVLAHEIKNPVTAINVALRAVADQLGEDHQEVLEDLVSRMRRLEQLLRGTLSFARPLEVRRRPVEAADFLAAVVGHLQTQIREQGASVSVQVDGAPRFQADPELLDEVVSNLIGNSVEARAGAHIVVSAVPDGRDGMLIAVDDDGPGIPETMRAGVFKPFVTTKKSGTGLGLAICRRIIEEHGGTIEATRSVLGGARIVVRLPNSRVR
jgi:PAS domain S-box-containing protein